MRERYNLPAVVVSGNLFAYIVVVVVLADAFESGGEAEQQWRGEVGQLEVEGSGG